jgi:tetratricopeptide (TPR) repeat protein
MRIANLFNRQELNSIENSIRNGNFDEALQKLEILKKKRELPGNIHVRTQIMESRILVQRGDLEKGLELAEQAFKESEKIEKPNLIVDALISQASALFEFGKFDECLKKVEMGENILNGIEIIDQGEMTEKTARFNHLKGRVFRKKGDMTQALEFLEKALTIQDKLKNKSDRASLLNDIGIIHASKGEFDPALTYLHQSLEIREELGNELETIKLFNNIGLIYNYKGEPDQALEYYNKSLDLSEKFGNKQIAATLLLNMGLIYMNKGEISSALDHNQRSLVLYEELNSEYEIATCLNNIGHIYDTIGDLDKSLEVHSKSLELFEKLGNKANTARSLLNIGNVLRTTGNIDKASSNYEKSLELLEEAGSGNIEISTALCNLISLTVDFGSVEDTQPYMQKLQKIHEGDKNKAIDQIYRFAKALISKSSDRVIKQAEAQQVFQQISEEEIIHHEITVEAMLYLSEMLLRELRRSGNEEVLTEIKSLSNKLQTIAENQHSYRLLANTYMLQSRIALLELDLNSARQILSQAQKIAEEKGLQRLAMRISGEYDALLDQLGKWTDLIDSNVSLIEKLELTELEGMVSQIIRKKAEVTELTEEDPALFLILSNDGKVKFSKQFVSEKVLDDRIIGDLLTAINSFVQETFSATGSIERIKHREHTLILKPIEPLLCCYVFKGQSYSALQKLDTFVEKMKDSRTLWKMLTTPTDPDQPLLHETEIEEAVTSVFLSPHYQVALQDSV